MKKDLQIKDYPNMFPDREEEIDPTRLKNVRIRDRKIKGEIPQWEISEFVDVGIQFEIVVAVSSNAVIGRDGKMPWHMPDDLKHFKKLTKGLPIIMGRKTWDSLPTKPLVGRKNIVLSRSEIDVPEEVLVAHSLEEAMDTASNLDAEKVMVIGGGEIYRLFIPYVRRIYLTEIQEPLQGDTYFPPWTPNQKELENSGWKIIEENYHHKGKRNEYNYCFFTLERKSKSFL